MRHHEQLVPTREEEGHARTAVDVEEGPLDIEGHFSSLKPSNYGLHHPTLTNAIEFSREVLAVRLQSGLELVYIYRRSRLVLIMPRKWFGNDLTLLEIRHLEEVLGIHDVLEGSCSVVGEHSGLVAQVDRFIVCTEGVAPGFEHLYVRDLEPLFFTTEQSKPLVSLGDLIRGGASLVR